MEQSSLAAKAQDEALMSQVQTRALPPPTHHLPPFSSLFPLSLLLSSPIRGLIVLLRCKPEPSLIASPH